jgi:hypothetical protein
MGPPEAYTIGGQDTGCQIMWGGDYNPIAFNEDGSELGYDGGVPKPTTYTDIPVIYADAARSCKYDFDSTTRAPIVYNADGTLIDTSQGMPMGDYQMYDADGLPLNPQGKQPKGKDGDGMPEGAPKSDMGKKGGYKGYDYYEPYDQNKEIPACARVLDKWIAEEH